MSKELFKAEGFDSKEELMFSYYLTELKDAGFIKEIIFHPDSFTLAEDICVNAFVKKKDYNKPVEIKLARGAQYTADFMVVWTKKAEGIVSWRAGNVYEEGFYPYRKSKANNHIPFFSFNYEDEVVSFVDTKGTGFRHGDKSGTVFSLTQKWMLSKDIFVQKVVVSLDEKSIFAKTFTPRLVIKNEVYQKNCQWGKEGETKLKYNPKLLEHWLR